MHTRVLILATVGLLLSNSACTAILDIEGEGQCWCGEQWKVQIAGATTFTIVGIGVSIPADSTTYETCVSQLEHLALDTADPQDPLYVAIRGSLESAAIAKCEAAGAAAWGIAFGSTNCATTGTAPVSTNLVHVGACWKPEDWDNQEYCPLFPECRPYYDCAEPDDWVLGDDEAGDDVLWECDEPPR